MIYNNITETIGNTPLLLLNSKVTGLKNINLYAKLEHLNPFGSIKDRTGLALMQDLLSKEAKDITVLESSSGNTAKALQAICSINGYPFKTLTRRIRVPEVKKILQAIGAQIEEYPSKSQCHDPNDPNDVMNQIHRRVKENPDQYYWTNQYYNKSNYKYHLAHTGQEISNDLGQIDFLIASLGTTGSSRGIIEALGKTSPELQTFGVVSTEDDFIPGIRSISELAEVGIYKPELYQEVIAVDALDAAKAALQLAQKFGVIAGPSSGAVYKAAIDRLREIDSTLTSQKNAVIIVTDRLEWYLSYLEERLPSIFGSQKTSSFASYRYKEETTPQLTPSDLSDRLGQQRLSIIDIRSNIAYKVGHIETAVNIYEDTLIQMIDSGSVFDHTSTIVIVCSEGKRSKKLASFLEAQGLTAYSLEGGLYSWRDNNLPLIRS